MINFGKYDQKVSFISFQDVDDGFGGNVPTASTVLSTFARVQQLRGSNAIEASQLVLPNTYEIAIQYRSSFTPDESMQILYKSTYHKVTGVRINHERQHKEYIVTAVSTGQTQAFQNNLNATLDLTL
jgi:SPP1 family predicted phage head-tail adaptor